MREIIIDNEFMLLLPPLDKQTYAWLEENILQHGCREPIVLWNGILIDGHNRYEISMKHGVEFKTADMEFDSRDGVIVWIISTQVSRRNLTSMQLSFYRGLHYNTEKRIYTKVREANEQRNPEIFHHNDGISNNGPTAARLADQYNVSQATIERDAKLAHVITAIGRESSEAKRKILSGKPSISRKRLRAMSGEQENDIAEIAASIEDGTFVSRQVGETAPVMDSKFDENDFAEAQPLEVLVNRITDDIYTELRALARDGDEKALKTALRDSIVILEELYEKI